MIAQIHCSQCSKPPFARGFCQSHYQQAARNGTIEIKPHSLNTPTLRKLKKIQSNINLRCNYPGTHRYENYGGRGIKNLLTLTDLQHLWNRDNADSMTQPSIDRIDPDGNYQLSNCQFIEMLLNRRRLARCPRCAAEKPRNHRDYRNLCASCSKIGMCKRCGKEFTRERKEQICRPCLWITKPCSFCGKPLTRNSGQTKYGARSNLWFCSKSEQGKWLGQFH